MTYLLCIRGLHSSHGLGLVLDFLDLRLRRQARNRRQIWTKYPSPAAKTIVGAAGWTPCYWWAPADKMFSNIAKLHALVQGISIYIFKSSTWRFQQLTCWLAKSKYHIIDANHEIASLCFWKLGSYYWWQYLRDTGCSVPIGLIFYRERALQQLRMKRKRKGER